MAKVQCWSKTDEGKQILVHLDGTIKSLYLLAAESDDIVVLGDKPDGEGQTYMRILPRENEKPGLADLTQPDYWCFKDRPDAT